MNAYEELMEYLNPGESVIGVVFGPWGWGYGPREGGKWESGYSEPGCDDLAPPDAPPVPYSVRGRVLSLGDAAPFMTGWEFSGGFGAPYCYAVNIWTTERVIFVTEYDGSTDLQSVPRNPVDCIPEMQGVEMCGDVTNADRAAWGRGCINALPEPDVDTVTNAVDCITDVLHTVREDCGRNNVLAVLRMVRTHYEAETGEAI